MSKLAEIKQRHRQDYIDSSNNRKVQLHEDRGYLLSLLEQTENDLSEIIDLLIGDRYGEAWERSLEAYKNLRLKSIQEG
jgi:hypothetical protein